jgi:N-methylhydantoinase A
MCVDTGGTFTDLVVDDGLSFEVYKSPTTPSDPIIGVLRVIAAAAQSRGVEVGELLGATDIFVHATTQSLNAVLTGRTARTAFLTTAGHPDVLVLREGGREHFDARAVFPKPYVPRSLTFEVVERVASTGDVVASLDREHAAQTIGGLARLEVEAVAVCLLWSIVNPAHELSVGRLLDELMPEVPYTLSHQLSPSLREYRRASAAAIDASLKPLMTAYLGGLSTRLHAAGFEGRLLMVTSAGALLDVDEVAAAPIHSLKSGPAMAPVAARLVVGRELGRSGAVVTDTGGTSYDVSLVRAGEIPWTRETWIGEPYLGHMTGFPSVDVRSYGAGGGSIASVDRGGLLRVGPESAGADPGPAAYKLGGTRATFTDAAVLLGWIDPLDFLGGTIRLDADAARAAMTRDVGEPLGLDAIEAAAAVALLMTEQMVRAVEDMTLRQGLDPAEVPLVAGGGAAGLNVVAVARRLGCVDVLVPDVSAVLSAAGGLVSDLAKDFIATHPTRTSSFDHVGVAQVLDELRAQAKAFLDGVVPPGASTRIDLFAEAHYAREVWEIEVAVTDGVADEHAVEQLRRAFHARHEELYAVSDPHAVIEVISWRIRASCRVPSRGARAVARDDSGPPPRPRRRAWFERAGWVDTPVYELAHLALGESMPGPALVTSSVTTTVIDPGAELALTPGGCLHVRVG